jgi:hypothetical protein
VIISQCSFINSNTSTTLVGEVDNGRVNVYFGVGEEKSLYNSPNCYIIPTIQIFKKCSKIKVYFNNQKLNKIRTHEATLKIFK